jgi:hypothetical protein
MKLPTTFSGLGLLPPGDYELTFPEIRRSMLVQGPADAPKTWDKEWRGKLVDNLEILARQLWQVGIEKIFIDGSFVENKDHPNDIDGYFECDVVQMLTGKLQRALNRLDANKVWVWDKESRRPHPDFEKLQLPMWHEYRVELFPHYHINFSGIVDKFGYELQFPSAFRQSRQEHRAKGIVRILKDTGGTL